MDEEDMIADKPTLARTTTNKFYVAPDVGLSKHLQESWQLKLLFDYTIQVGDEEFKVHKIVMASVSDYFRAMLTGGMVESQTDRVRLEGLDPLAVSNIIEYIYTNSMTGERASAEDLLACAMYLQVSTAIEAASNMVQKKIDKDNCFDILRSFKTYSLTEAVEYTEGYINTNLDNIFQVCTPEKVPYEYMEMFIEHWKGGEWDLFLTIKDWVDVDYEKRKQHRDSLLTKVQYNLLTPAEIEAVKKMKLYTEGTWQEHLKCDEYYRNLPIHEKMISHCVERRKPSAVFFNCESSSTMHILQEDGQWKPRQVPATPDFSTGVVAAFEVNNFLIVCEGYSSNQKWHVFDPTTLTWSAMPSMNVPRADFALVEYGEYLYALGGLTGLGTDLESVTDTIERYDMEKNAWTVLPTTLPVPLYAHSACLYCDTDIYITGGKETTDWDEDEFSKRLDCFNPSEDPIIWRSNAPRRFGSQCLLMRQVLIKAEMHIVVIASTFWVQSYNVETDHWTAFYNQTVQRPFWKENATIIAADRRYTTFRFYILNTNFRPIHSDPMLFDNFCAKWTWNGDEEEWDEQEILQSFPNLNNLEVCFGKNYIAALLALPMPSERPSDLEPPTPSVRELSVV